MYTHTIYNIDGKVVAQKQQEQTAIQPTKAYNSLDEQLDAEKWDFRGTELFRRSVTNFGFSIVSRM